MPIGEDKPALKISYKNIVNFIIFGNRVFGLSLKNLIIDKNIKLDSLLRNNENKNICLKTFLILLERTFEIFQLSETKFLNIESKNFENTDENRTKFANPI